MTTATLVPVEEYLRTVYRPDCDYVDGEVQERNLGEQFHSLVQAAFTAIFRSHRNDWGIRTLPEQRVQVAPDQYRVPDVCLVSSSDPIEPVLRKPPMLCVEVLSPEDRFQRIHQRVREYQNMGVENVWVVDPESRQIWIAQSKEDLKAFEANALPVPGTDAFLPIAAIFAEIDEAPLS